MGAARAAKVVLCELGLLMTQWMYWEMVFGLGVISD